MGFRTVLQAVKGFYLATPALMTAFPSGLWLGWAPEKTATPFLVVEHKGQPTSWESEGTAVEETHLDVCAVAAGADQADALARLVQDAFDPFVPQVDGQGATYFLQENYALEPAAKGPDGALVAIGRTSYRVRMTRLRNMAT